MRLIRHTKYGLSLLILTLSVCLMFAAATVLSLAAFTVSSGLDGSVIGMIAKVITVWTPAVLLWIIVALLLDIYFIKLQSRREDGPIIRAVLIAYFLTSGWAGYQIASQFPIAYGWFLTTSIVLMIIAAAAFQWSINMDNSTCEKKQLRQNIWFTVFGLSWITLTLLVGQTTYVAWNQPGLYSGLLTWYNAFLMTFILAYIAESLPKWEALSAGKQSVILVLVVFSAFIGILLTPITGISLLPWTNTFPLVLASVGMTILFIVMFKYNWSGMSWLLPARRNNHRPRNT